MTQSAPLPPDEEQRLAALRRYAIVDTDPNETSFKRIVELASRQFDVPIALISLVDADRQWFKASCGLDASGSGRDVAFCAHAILSDDVLYVPDARDDARFANNPFVTEGLKIRFYAGAPLITPDGHKLGTLCLIDDKPRHDFSTRDKVLLTDLAAVVADQIEMRFATGNVLTEMEGRIRAEDDLAIAQHQLKLFFEHAPVSVAMLDRGMRYMGASRRWRDTFRMGEAALAGCDHFELLEHLPEHWRQAYETCLEGDVLDLAEDRLPRADGGFHWIRHQVRPWIQRDGDIGGVIAFVEIIDEEKAAASDLEHNRRFLQAVLDNIKDGVVACDGDGHLSLFNAATRRFHGLDSRPIPPEQWAEHYDLYEADGTTPLAMERVPLFRALNGTTVTGQEMVIAPKNGPKRRVVADAVAMRDSKGNKMGAVASMHDVTNQRLAEERWQEAEQRYRAIFNHTFQFCGLLDLDGTLLEANDTAIDFTGLTRADLVGLPFWECHWWQVGDEAKKRLKRAITQARNGRFVRYEAIVQGAEGRRTPIDFSLKPVSDDDGRIVQLIAEGRDISDKRETETSLRLITDNVPFLIGSVDADLKYRFINKTGAQWLARSQDEIVGAGVGEVFGADSVAPIAELIDRVQREGSVRFERKVRYPDGQERAIEGAYVALKTADGDYDGFIGLAMDMTGRQRAEDALRQNQRELELILNNVPVRIFYKDDKNRILRLNKPAADSLGLSVAAAEGADTYDLFPEMAKKYHDDDLAVIESNTPTLGIVEKYTPLQGDPSWVRTDKVPYTDPDTGARSIFVAASDITSEKEAEEALKAKEERYRSLYNNTPVMLHSIDAAGRLLSVSDFWLEKLGYERDEVIGRKSTDFLTPESQAVSKQVLADFMQSGVCKDVEYQMITKSGAIIDVLLSAIAERDDTGAFVNSLAVMTDITDRKQVERQFVQAQKMESVGQLTGGLAHDFNNLLGVVMGNLQLIERRLGDDEKAAKRIATALSAVNKGAELTRRLLAFSRRQQLETKTVDPNPLIESMSAMLQRTLGGSVALQCSLGEGVANVTTDPAQFESALLNLAVNARDAMPDGGRLTIESTNVRLDADYADREGIEAGNYVMIAISDTGAGIDADKLDRVFEPFFTTKDVGKGSGLGLSMVYGFIKQSGGHVRIYSEVGHGTTVRMYLPTDDSDAVPAPGHAPAEPSDADLSGTETILVVEDQDEVRDVAVALLEDLGYALRQAPSGREALALLDREQDIDLLFTDIVMAGGMNGTQLASAVAKRRPDLPVVFTTGYAEAAVLRDGDVKAATNLVTKPYNRTELARKIRAALDAAGKKAPTAA
ncbi:MAG: PAS domain S-box protein [Phyllobacteriaceae bacterium]|nr:PAS domain S-box protein [Phyllobacteriaceae bacterium]